MSISLLTGTLMMISNSINYLLGNLSLLEESSVNQIDAKNVMTFDDAAAYLHIDTVSLELICSDISGVQTPYIKVGGQYIFTKQGLDKWLESTRLNLDFD